MFQTQQQTSSRTDAQDLEEMESPKPSTCQYSTPSYSSPSSSEATSPCPSSYSRGLNIWSGSAPSSTPSSPAIRNSFDAYLTTKTLLTDVKEEPLERDDADMTGVKLDTIEPEADPQPIELPADVPDFNSAMLEPYDFHEGDLSDFTHGGSSFKKRRSSTSSTPLANNRISNRFPSRFPSFSRRWKTKSGASPKLSIVTHPDPISPRTSSATSLLVSPAISVVSQHEAFLPTSSPQSGIDEVSSPTIPPPIDIDQANAFREDDQGAATTPLLPPLLMKSNPRTEKPLGSPLQSPTVAGTPTVPACTPIGTPQISYLPSPPLSSKPSLASLRQRSRAGTIVSSSDIPLLRSLGEQDDDEWSLKLGHANFTITPEPYLPDFSTIEAFRDFRDDWSTARHNYAKHLARIGEHYGSTSKIFLLTEEKWTAVDLTWKKHNASISTAVGPVVPSTMAQSKDRHSNSAVGVVLDQPPSRVVVPKIDDPSGKFPALGDEDIVGPMSVAPVKFQSTAQLAESNMDNRPTKKRNFWKFVSDFLGRGAVTGLRA